MTTILAFDSKSLQYLLDEKHKKYFDTNFPIIYKTKIYRKINERNRQIDYYYKSAVDVALKNDQALGLSCIVEYIAQF